VPTKHGISAINYEHRLRAQPTPTSKGDRMNRIPPLLIALMVGLCCACAKSPETLMKSGYDEREMDAAIARARSEVDSFIAELSKQNGADFAVKAPIEDRGQVEHFWLTSVVFKDGQFEGEIGNDPGIVRNVKLGQKWTIKKMEISDWMFMRDGKMHGNYTMRPFFKSMPAEEAAKMKSILATP
jgi:uncharacterized protein YegJ (DUF2314 family)